MKRIISLILLVALFLPAFDLPIFETQNKQNNLKTQAVYASYEIEPPITLSQENPKFNSGGGLFCDMIEIQPVKFETVKGGFIRLKTYTEGECFSLKIYQVPDGMSFKDAMPYVDQLPCIGELTGRKGNEFKWVKTGRYICVLRSKAPYLYEWQEEEHRQMQEEYQMLFTGKTGGW